MVDDGVATGATARAQARSARERGAAHVILAAPVIAEGAVPDLRSDHDDVVAVEFPEPFVAVGLSYDRFAQTSDEEVPVAAKGLVHAVGHRPAPHAPAAPE